jgi:hypothetical protein
MTVGALRYGCSVDGTNTEQRRDDLTAAFRRARDRARISSARYMAALENGDPDRLVEAADAAALDAGYVSGLARHVRNLL